MLLGHAVGDAVGVPVEFSSRLKLKNNPVTNMRAFGTYNQPAGTWSDDTSLTVAAMESIARLKKIDYGDIMQNFADWHGNNKFTANDETFDCGNTTGAAIRNFLEGNAPLSCGISDEYSNGNGSLMRIFPAAVYIYMTRGNNFDEDAIDTIHKFSALTHAHKRSFVACVIYCRIAAEIFDGQNLSSAIHAGFEKSMDYYSGRSDFSDEVNHYRFFFPENFGALPEEKINSRGYVVDALKAALWCLLNTEDYKSLVLRAVNLGGDTDTIAAIAGGLAGAFYGVENIPADWLTTLKKKSYLEKIAADFYQKAA